MWQLLVMLAPDASASSHRFMLRLGYSGPYTSMRLLPGGGASFFLWLTMMSAPWWCIKSTHTGRQQKGGKGKSERSECGLLQERHIMVKVQKVQTRFQWMLPRQHDWTEQALRTRDAALQRWLLIIMTLVAMPRLCCSCIG